MPSAPELRQQQLDDAYQSHSRRPGQTRAAYQEALVRLAYAGAVGGVHLSSLAYRFVLYRLARGPGWTEFDATAADGLGCSRFALLEARRELEGAGILWALVVPSDYYMPDGKRLTRGANKGDRKRTQNIQIALWVDVERLAELLSTPGRMLSSGLPRKTASRRATREGLPIGIERLRVETAAGAAGENEPSDGQENDPSSRISRVIEETPSLPSHAEAAGEALRGGPLRGKSRSRLAPAAGAAVTAPAESEERGDATRPPTLVANDVNAHRRELVREREQRLGQDLPAEVGPIAQAWDDLAMPDPRFDDGVSVCGSRETRALASRLEEGATLDELAQAVRGAECLREAARRGVLCAKRKDGCAFAIVFASVATVRKYASRGRETGFVASSSPGVLRDERKGPDVAPAEGPRATREEVQGALAQVDCLLRSTPPARDFVAREGASAPRDEDE